MIGNWGRPVTAALAALLLLLTVSPAYAAEPSGAAGGGGGPTPPDDPLVESLPGEKVDSFVDDRTQRPGTVETPAVEIALKLRRDGSLSVTETITVDGDGITARLPLRVSASEERWRVYSVSELRVRGAGSARVSDGDLVIHAESGKTTLSYVVTGAVTRVDGGQRVRWRLAGGFDTGIATVRASFIAPTRATTALECELGGASAASCDLAAVDHTGVVRVEQHDLPAGASMTLSVEIPAGTVPANAVFERKQTLATAFAMTEPVGTGFLVLAVLLVIGAGYVWLARRRDAVAHDVRSGPVDMLRRDGDRAYFVSPDGLLPGQIGTVVDGTVDPVDVSATVIDLAVRNYLWLCEVSAPDGGSDWQLSLRNPPDGNLREFERTLLDTLFGEERGTVLLSELRTDDGRALESVRAAMYSDVVRQRWFSRRPDSSRGRLTRVGAGLAGIGVAATVALAFTIGHALLGVAVVIAGLAVLLASLWLPSRTKRGRLLVGQVRGLFDYVSATGPDDLPAADREMVFSRSLPYAVVLGSTEGWLRSFVDLDPSADGEAGVYWFGGTEEGRDLRRFAARLRAFLTALDGVLTESGRLRSVRAPGR